MLALTTASAWRDWLRAEGATSSAVWLTVWKKAAGPDLLNRDEVVDEALCQGWIDSTVNSFDELSYLLLVAPRKRGSVWSAVNKGRLERLAEQGRIGAAGQAVIDAAVEDGSWTILDPVEALEEPDDLVAAIESAGVGEVWGGWSRSRRKLVLSGLVLAKTETTRRARIAEAIGQLSGA